MLTSESLLGQLTHLPPRNQGEWDAATVDGAQGLRTVLTNIQTWLLTWPGDKSAGYLSKVIRDNKDTNLSELMAYLYDLRERLDRQVYAGVEGVHHDPEAPIKGIDVPAPAATPVPSSSIEVRHWHDEVRDWVLDHAGWMGVIIIVVVLLTAFGIGAPWWLK